MANRKVDPEKKRIPLMTTIQKNIIDKIKIKAELENTSLSSLIEKIIINYLREN